jgi:hypothetical protein
MSTDKARLPICQPDQLSNRDKCALVHLGKGGRDDPKSEPLCNDPSAADRFRTSAGITGNFAARRQTLVDRPLKSSAPLM